MGVHGALAGGVRKHVSPHFGFRLRGVAVAGKVMTTRYGSAEDPNHEAVEGSSRVTGAFFEPSLIIGPFWRWYFGPRTRFGFLKVEDEHLEGTDPKGKPFVTTIRSRAVWTVGGETGFFLGSRDQWDLHIGFMMQPPESIFVYYGICLAF